MINFDLFGKPFLPRGSQYRIPYMGSKRKLAKILFEKMLEVKPNTKYFYDLFGGGGAMSFYALELGLWVHYNEKQKGLVDLLNYILQRARNNERSKYGIFPEDFYKFITREEFKKLQAEDSIKGQFARICYSFGNKQKDYLFGNIETKKHLAHNIVVFQDKVACEEFNDLFKMNIKISDKSTINDRRFDYMSFFTREQRDNTEAQLEQLERLEQLQQLQQLQQLEQLLQLEQLERLERLERLQQLPKFNITNLSFQDVKIETPIDDTIIYLDPPYRGTTTYLEEDTLHSVIDDFFLRTPYSCFMSEYNAPFQSILEIETRSTLSATSNTTKAFEKLYYNKK